jgi:ubiquinone/menaquinone biosynthesis C-methylase UbiE
MSGDILKHLRDKVNYLEEPYRVLKPDEVFILNSPRTSWEQSFAKADPPITWVGLNIAMHLFTAGKQVDKWTSKRAGKRVDRQAGKQVSRQAGRQAGNLRE